MYDLNLCMYIWIFWLVESSWLLYILLWVPSWTCVTVATLIPPASRACCDVHEALGGAFSERHHVDCGVIAIICKVPILGRHTPLVNCGPRSNFLYIAITVYCFTFLFTFLHTITFYHSICSILCLQQTDEIENLIVSWGKVLGCVVCRFHVAARWRSSYVNYAPVLFWRRCSECHEANKHHLRKFGFLLLVH
jgi:hypothetical protein